LDISKAYDQVSSGVLLTKIHKHFNIPDHIVAWISSWLKQTSLQVRSNGSISSPYPIAQGLFQGPPLPVFLFQVYLSDLSLGVSILFMDHRVLLESAEILGKSFYQRSSLDLIRSCYGPV
jgi:hypothetical protein